MTRQATRRQSADKQRRARELHRREMQWHCSDSMGMAKRAKARLRKGKAEHGGAALGHGGGTAMRRPAGARSVFRKFRRC